MNPFIYDTYTSANNRNSDWLPDIYICTPVNGLFGFAHIADGDYPITHMFDNEGCLTNDFNEAISITAGNNERWYALALYEYNVLTKDQTH
jgi:hypothetical protein